MNVNIEMKQELSPRDNEIHYPQASGVIPQVKEGKSDMFGGCSAPDIQTIKQVSLQQMSAHPKKEKYYDEKDVMEKIKKATLSGKQEIKINSKKVQYKTLRLYCDMGYKCEKKKKKGFLKKLLPEQVIISWR